MAYHLELPKGSSIFLVFHIALLKPYQREPPIQVINPLPPLATESHPIICPTKVVAYREIKQKGVAVKQMLVEWEGLLAEQRTWEDINTISRLVHNLNLEDKIKSDGRRDVTINLDMEEVVSRL